MDRLPFYRFPPDQGPLSRILSVLTLLVIFSLAFLVGTVLFVTVLGVLAILFLGFYLRFWWLRRKLQQQVTARQGGVTLEGEYTVSKRGRQPEPDDRS
jgi:hypothetical protein